MFKNLTIRAKLYLTFGLLIVLLGVIFVFGWDSLRKMNDRLNRISDTTAQKVELGEKLDKEVLEVADAEKDLLLVDNKQEMQDILNEVEETRSSIEKETRELSEITTGEGVEYLQDFENKWQDFLAIHDQIVEYAMLNSNNIAENISTDQATNPYQKSVQNIQQVINISSGEVNRMAVELYQALVDLRAQEREIILADNESNINEFKEQITRDNEIIIRDLRELKNLASSSGILNQLKAFETHYNNYFDLNQQVVEKAVENGNNRAFDLYANEAQPLYQEISTLLTDIVDKNNEQLDTDAMTSDQNFQEARNGMAIITLIALFLAITISYVLITNINRSLREANDVVKRVSEGDLTAEAEIQSKDEIGQLMENINRMVDKLKEIVQSIRTGSDNIAAASQQVSSTSQQLSQGSSEQASSAEEVSSSMEEMTSNIQQNADNAHQTDKISTEATKRIKEGNEATQNSVESMKEIAEKISIINDIAYQTNILALNAAVEAARAGEHGKGFAVVASEVRKLAERSSEAASEIDEKSKSGVEISEKAGSQLEEIVPEIEKTSGLVQEISASSNEMNNGAEQVNTAVQQLNQVTQQNAAASEELATSAEELSGQAEQLNEIVNFFKTDETVQNKPYTAGKEQKHLQSNVAHMKQQNNQGNGGGNGASAQNTQSSLKSSDENEQTANGNNNGADLKMYNDSRESDQNFEKY